MKNYLRDKEYRTAFEDIHFKYLEREENSERKMSRILTSGLMVLVGGIFSLLPYESSSENQYLNNRQHIGYNLLKLGFGISAIGGVLGLGSTIYDSKRKKKELDELKVEYQIK